ncbi:MAG TPA: FxSxx-COOH system tetratricopeptide repeat protein [Terriglobales bacterium]|nr:FxSxx-COOH system tetratricopeptide repeat protein [Terriglobales bacterium]
MGGLGARIRGWRAGLGLSQEALAEAVGVSPRSINRWEQDQSEPQPEHRRRLARLFGVELGDLVPAHPPGPPWHVPLRRNLLFTGREADLDRLREALAPGSASSRLVALTGLPGVGKTQTALEFAYRHADRYTGVFWLPADTRDGCLAALGELAAALDLALGPDPDQRYIHAQVGRWFRQHHGWLLVLDNLEDPALLDEVVPAGHGSILLTTRARAIGTAGERLELTPMSREVGSRFLLRRARVVASEAELDGASAADRATAEILVSRLGGLPLALDQAGAYMEETGCGLYRYLDRFQAEQRALMDRRGRLTGDHPESVATTIELAGRRVERMNPAAGDLLRLCAFLHPDAIPLEIVNGEADPIGVDEALADLATLSLVQRDPLSDTLTLHRLVQEVVRTALPPDEERRWAERAVQAVGQALPGSGPFQFGEALRWVAQASAAVELVQRWGLRSAVAARLLDWMGAHQLITGEYAASRRSLVRAWQLRGRDCLDTAETLAHLAELAFAGGRYRRAETLVRAALRIRRRDLGRDHLLVGNALGLLGDVLAELGRYAEAELLLEQALAIQTDRLGPEHPAVAVTLCRLGRVPFMQGRYEDAERLGRRALAINERALGADHFVTGVNVDWLGTVYRYWGRDQDAVVQFERALAILSDALGDDHPTALTVLNGMARAKHGLGAHDEAEVLARRAMEVRERMLGPEHPKVAFSLVCLAEILIAQERLDEAEALAGRSLAIRERTYGGEHQTVALSLDVLAQIRQRRGDLAGAERLYERAVATLERVVGGDQPRAASTRRRYASLLEAARRRG